MCQKFFDDLARNFSQRLQYGGITLAEKKGWKLMGVKEVSGENIRPVGKVCFGATWITAGIVL